MGKPHARPAPKPTTFAPPPKAPAYDACTAILIGVDQAAVEAELKWGIGRLPLLVSDATRLRFRKACDLWRQALNAWDPELVEQSGAIMRRAWAALDAEALEAGHQPMAPEVWEVALPNGAVAALVRTPEEAHHVAASGREVEVYTLDEIGRILGRYRDAVSQVLVAFPGARVTRNERPQITTPGYAADWCAAEPLLDVIHGEGVVEGELADAAS